MLLGGSGLDMGVTWLLPQMLCLLQHFAFTPEGLE